MTIDEMYDEYLTLKKKLNSVSELDNHYWEYSKELNNKINEIIKALNYEFVYILKDGTVLIPVNGSISVRKIMKTKKIEVNTFTINESIQFVLFLPRNSNIKGIVDCKLVVEGDYSVTEAVYFVVLSDGSDVIPNYSTYCGSFMDDEKVKHLYKESK